MEVNLPFLFFFTLYLRAIFQVQAPWGAYIWSGDVTAGFFVLPVWGGGGGGGVFGGGGTYTGRGVFSEFYSILSRLAALPLLFQTDQKAL